MQDKVLVEKETHNSGTKKQYDVFVNKHNKQITHALHIHSYYETLLLLEGKLIVQIGDSDTVLLSPGDIIFIPPHVVHDTYLDQTHPTLMRSIVVKFSPLFLYPMETTQSDINCLLMKPTYKEQYYLFRKDEQHTASLERIMHKILTEKQRMAQGFELALRGLFSTLYVKLVRICAKNDENEQLQKEQGVEQKIDEDSAQKLHQVMSYIKENYQYNISMQEVADLCGMNYYHFSRFFKKVTNQKFNEYLLETRLNSAQKKLLQSEKSISEIAMECGFEYVSYFIQKFKRKNGMTPREYQKKYRGFILQNPDVIFTSHNEAPLQ